MAYGIYTSTNGCRQQASQMFSHPNSPLTNNGRDSNAFQDGYNSVEMQYIAARTNDLQKIVHGYVSSMTGAS